MTTRITTAAIAMQLLSVAPSLHAATVATVATSTEDEQGKLAMQLSNPVAALISVPLQSNWDFGIGPSDAYQYKLNVQPVVPITLNEDWNLISRTILPVIDAESPAPGIDDVSGLGNATQSFFLSPQKPADGVIWGVGPVILIPTATDDLLGYNQWGAGPTVVALKQTDGWTYGALANHLWSFEGGNDATNATYVQPFVSYTTRMHTTFLVNAESTYDWENSQWSIPLNFAVAQLVKIGELPVQFQAGVRSYVDGPDDGPNWGLRFAVTFLFPKS